MNFLKNIRGLSDSAKLAEALTDIDAKLDGCRQQKDSLLAKREQAMFESDAAYSKLKADIAAVSAEIDDLTIAREGVARRHTAALEAENLAALTKTMDEARKAKEKLAERCRSFTAAAKTLVAIANEIEALQRTVSVANQLARDSGHSELSVGVLAAEMAAKVGRQVSLPHVGMTIPNVYPAHPDGSPWAA